MPKKTVRAEISSFAKGFITEASPVNFPEGALSSVINFEINKDGTIDRRLGMDIEEGTVEIDSFITPSNISSTNISTFVWPNVSGINDQEFLVIQSGEYLLFIDNTKSSITSSEYVGNLYLEVGRNFKMAFTSVNGKLIATLPSGRIAVIEYSEGVFNYYIDTLKIRDLFGVSVVIDDKDLSSEKYIAFRPTTGSSEHFYNLRNQTFGLSKRVSTGGADNVSNDPAAATYVISSAYPSNSDSIWTGVYFSTPKDEVFDVIKMNDSKDGKVSSPKGFFIIDALRRGSSRLEAWQINQTEQGFTELPVASLPADITPEGASVLAEHAGRVFFGGFSGEIMDGDNNSPSLSSYVFFSQLVKRTPDVFKCYQEGDPTGRADSDIIDTDGGFIRISGAKKILALQPLNETLLVFADNGVWAIRGGADYGFSAKNYNVIKICSYGLRASTPLVNEGGAVFFWSVDGIYVISKNQYGDLVADNITDTSIKSFYDEINVTPSNYVRAIYDKTQRKIRWLYNLNPANTGEDLVRELIFDVVLKCFYVLEIKRTISNEIAIVDFFNTPPFSISTIIESIVADSVPVNANSTSVVIETEVRQTGVKTVKYLALKYTPTSILFTFSSYFNNTFRDWKAVDDVGSDAKAEFTTGIVTAGDSAIQKQIPYLVSHFRRTESGFELIGNDIVPKNQSSCLIRSQWDWANTVNSKKWSSVFQAYRYPRFYIPVDIDDTFDTGFELITTKNKIRGRGRAFCFNVQTEQDKDCRMVGWSLSVNGNSLT